MPIKFLFWNIQTFTINKISDTKKPAKKKQRAATPPIPAQYRRDYILQTVTEADPAVFVLIELISNKGFKGSLVKGGGRTGSLSLLEALREQQNSWCLVPPLKLVDELTTAEFDPGMSEVVKENQTTEAIAVYFRNDLLEFRGPYCWPQTADNDNTAKTAVPTGPTTESYPDPWTDALPAANHYAGQYELVDANGNELYFDTNTSRRPWITSFRERNVPHPRDFRVVSLHLPPDSTRARMAMHQLADFFRTDPLGADEIVIVGGDLNLNNLLEGGRLNFDTRYAFCDMVAAGFQNPPVILAPTMYRAARKATRGDYNQPLGLDNVFLKFGANLLPAPAHNELVVDRVSGDPARGFTSSMKTALAAMTSDDELRKPENYGHIGPNPGTSDHMPILFEL